MAGPFEALRSRVRVPWAPRAWRSLGRVRSGSGRSPVRRVATVAVAGLMTAGAVVPVARRLAGPRPARRRRDRRSLVVPATTAAARPDSDPMPFTVRWPEPAGGAGATSD